MLRNNHTSHSYEQCSTTNAVLSAHSTLQLLQNRKDRNIHRTNLEQVCAGLQQFHSNEVMTQVIPVHQDPAGNLYFHLLSPETTRIIDSTTKAS
jgi:hypothetical protein